MNLKSRMKAIAAAPTLSELKNNADNLTHKHETIKKVAETHASNYAQKLGHHPYSTTEKGIKDYEDAKNHYYQHVMHKTHPEVHYTLTRLAKEAPQARLAYKRALRSK